ncbi:hypothetical protein MLD38_036786 [Melastoma candidum]|uniref:Uncharacterized protein n=1 Tax=Melastoma candidum TaxID=119954 RepID=A0ACB9LLY7_9MYRT|nr:hypothetical protein MLD38_036786 [Melastoma candidum]
MTLESLAVTDADGQGVLLTDRDQLEERRKEPKRMLPADIRMWEWYAPVVELSRGVVLKGGMVVAILPRPSNSEEQEMGLGWIEEELDGMHEEIVRMLVEGRTHRYHEISWCYYSF